MVRGRENFARSMVLSTLAVSWPMKCQLTLTQIFAERPVGSLCGLWAGPFPLRRFSFRSPC